MNNIISQKTFNMAVLVASILGALFAVVAICYSSAIPWTLLVGFYALGGFTADAYIKLNNPNKSDGSAATANIPKTQIRSALAMVAKAIALAAILALTFIQK